jgi:hypothetical protein
VIERHFARQIDAAYEAAKAERAQQGAARAAG